MKLTYIYHSCFCIQTKEVNIIIDFYKDTDHTDGFIYKNILSDSKKLYVLCTHSHLDHYNGEILEWEKKLKNITYIFSKDILYADITNKKDAVFLEKPERYEDENIMVKAYGSTDVGSSFYIEVGGKKIFHAGDLNNWHWNEESTEKEVKEAEEFYANELAIISKDIKKLDIAMFPIDPKLGKDFMKGAEQFIEAIDVDLLVPMHFDENYDKAKEFENIADKHNTKYWTITKKGQEINL